MSLRLLLKKGTLTGLNRNVLSIKRYSFKRSASERKEKNSSGFSSEITRNDIKCFGMISLMLIGVILGLNTMFGDLGWQTSLSQRVKRILETYNYKDFDETIRAARLTKESIIKSREDYKDSYKKLPFYKEYSIKTSFNRIIPVFTGFDNDLKVDKDFDDNYNVDLLWDEDSNIYIYSILFDLCSKSFFPCAFSEANVAVTYCIKEMNKINNPSKDLLRIKLQFYVLISKQYMGLNKFPEALENAVNACELYRSLCLDDKHLELVLQSLLSSCYISNRLLEDALELSLHLIKQSKMLQYHDILVAQFYNLGLILLLKERNEEALECFECILHFSNKLHRTDAITHITDTIKLIRDGLSSK